MLMSPPPSSKDVSPPPPHPLSQTSWEGYTALCIQRHSLFIFPSLILSLPHSRGTKSTGEGEGEVFHLDQKGQGEDLATKEQGNREGGGERRR